MSYLPLTTFIPAAAEQKSFTEMDATMILSALSLGDTSGRLLSGFVFDLKTLHRIR